MKPFKVTESILELAVQTGFNAGVRWYSSDDGEDFQEVLDKAKAEILEHVKFCQTLIETPKQ